jgi:SAM-dependent methyltransferase
MDTLRWARAGATVTGLDFSPTAIEEAIALAERAGLSGSSTFVCSDVYDAPESLLYQQFDVVYVSLGSLCWLPDIVAWAKVVATLLAPGGRFYLHDVHPLALALDDRGERIAHGYFEDQEHPIETDYDTTYTDGGNLTNTRTYEWNHSIGEIVSALIGQNLVLDSLVEHDWTVFHQFPWLVEKPSGVFSAPDDRPRVPLTLTLVAHSPLSRLTTAR